MDTLKFTIEYLEDEHEEILAFCNRMEEKCLEILKGQVDVEFFRRAISFIRLYADGLHHKKEEDILFKAMLDNLGPLAEKVVRGGMLVEHQMARDDFHVKETQEATPETKTKSNRSFSFKVKSGIIYLKFF